MENLGFGGRDGGFVDVSRDSQAPIVGGDDEVEGGGDAPPLGGDIAADGEARAHGTVGDGDATGGELDILREVERRWTGG